MTKEEIQALINAKIAGQGSAVDVGGALPAILSGIIDLIPAPAEPTHTLEILNGTGDDPVDAETALSLLKLDGKTPTIDDLMAVKTNWVVDSGEGGYLFSITVATVTQNFGNKEVYICFGGDYGDFGVYGRISISTVGKNCYIFIQEV